MQIVFQLCRHRAQSGERSVAEDIISRPLAFYHGLDRQPRSKHASTNCSTWFACPERCATVRPSEFSGGQKQRVNFAQRPGGQDPSSSSATKSPRRSTPSVAAAIIELLKELQRELGLSYIFISHDLSVVEAICDEIMVMYNGQRVEQITPDRPQAPTHPYSKLLFSSVPKLDPTWLDAASSATPEPRSQPMTAKSI